MIEKLREYRRVASSLYSMYLERIWEEKHPLVALLYYALIVLTFPVHFFLLLSLLHLANSFWEELMQKMMEEKVKEVKEENAAEN